MEQFNKKIETRDLDEALESEPLSEWSHSERGQSNGGPKEKVSN